MSLYIVVFNETTELQSNILKLDQKQDYYYQYNYIKTNKI